MRLKITSLNYNEDNETKLLNEIQKISEILKIKKIESNGFIHYFQLDNITDICNTVIILDSEMCGSFKYNIVNEENNLHIASLNYDEAIQCLEYLNEISKIGKLRKLFKILVSIFIIVAYILLSQKILRA